jgi:hypothetical protein
MMSVIEMYLKICNISVKLSIGDKMKVKIVCSESYFDVIKRIFEENGFDICEDAQFLFSEIGYRQEQVFAYSQSGEKTLININEIVQIETLENRVIFKMSDSSSYNSSQKLYSFQPNQFSEGLIRVNESQVININYGSRIHFY